MSKSKQHTSGPFQDVLSQIWPASFLQGIDKSITYLNKEYPDTEESSQAPIFIFSAGWRTGSTLLQRLVNSDSDVALFGEAFEHLFLWHQLANQFKNFSISDKRHSCYIPENYAKIFPNELDEFLTKAFTANLSPPVSHLKKAHQSFIETLLREPVERVGRKIWGLKLVRSDITIAKYLQWLYPKARFIFLVRNPYDTCNSCLNIIKRNKHALPLIVGSHYISNAHDYAAHWRHCISGFLEESKKLNSIMIKYEDLITGEKIKPISSFLNIKINKNILQNKVGETQKEEQLSEEDRIILEGIAGNQIKILGY
ncbi:MAG: sulfotransferase [Saonia sp.]